MFSLIPFVFADKEMLTVNVSQGGSDGTGTFGGLFINITIGGDDVNLTSFNMTKTLANCVNGAVYSVVPWAAIQSDIPINGKAFYPSPDLTLEAGKGYFVGCNYTTRVYSAATVSYPIVGTAFSITSTSIDDPPIYAPSNPYWMLIHSVTVEVISVISAAPTFTITAKDRYDSISLNNLSIRIFNSSFEINFSTSNGTMLILNSTTGSGNRPIIFNNTYDITFTSNESGGYFNYTVATINITDTGSLEGSLFQSLLNLYVNDSLTGGPLSSFTITTNYSSFEGTNGYILLYTKAGANHVFNVTSIKYPKGEFSYSINALENNSMTVNISPIFNFYLRREADNSEFDVGNTNSTKLKIFCPEKSIVIIFKNATYNSTQENITMDCPYTLMKMDISYGDTSYFRSLIPETIEQNITWWLLDLNIDTGVQKILELIDLTGEWSSGLLRIKTAIGSNNENIIEQEFDISTAVILYLLKDALYTVSIENNLRTEERQLGNLIADSAGTITITFPNIQFYPENTYLEDNISTSYFENATSNILRFTYLDTTHQTTLITWEIYNESSNLLQTFTSTSSDVSLTYNSFFENKTYFTNLEVQHALLDFNITEARVFGNPPSIASDLPGWTEEEATDLKLFIAIIFLVVWGFLFTSKHAALGLTTTFIWLLVFRWNGWIDIGYMALSIMGIIAISTWIVEIMKKE